MDLFSHSVFKKRKASLNNEQIVTFQSDVLDYYRHFGRSFSWRMNTEPYLVFLSELMLQQTQTKRVEEKLKEFIEAFPNFHALAEAKLSEVLERWKGLGYNRRAKYVHDAAKILVGQYAARIPMDREILKTLPGIGDYTSGSILSFAFNDPQVFIETNIRRYFISVFFSNKESVDDSEIFPLIEKTLYRDDVRTWYYALMDLGAELSKGGSNPNRKSRQYVKQSKFEGSDRQIRGALLRILDAKEKKLSEIKVNLMEKESLEPDTMKLEAILTGLIQDGLVAERSQKYFIAD